MSWSENIILKVDAPSSASTTHFVCLKVLTEVVICAMGSDGDGDGNEKVISKYYFSFLPLFRDFSNLEYVDSKCLWSNYHKRRYSKKKKRRRSAHVLEET